MRATLRSATVTLAAAALVLAACEPDVTATGPAMDVAAPTLALFGGGWADPVLVGPAVNSSFRELSPKLSPDKLSLYFNSNRPGAGPGLINVWVSRRACLDCPWQDAEPLPPPVNGPGIHGTVALSRDGHLLFWSSNRDGSLPAADGSEVSQDIWMVSRQDPNDDMAWTNPVRIESAPGCVGDGRVNTEADEFAGAHLVTAPDAPALLYFARGVTGYQVAVNRHGQAVGCAEPVPGIGTPAGAPTVRADGRELIFPAVRPGGQGSDLWVATRSNPTRPWSDPVNLGAPVNSPFGDLTPGLSHDGTTLVFAAAQARGGLGLQDIWITTRSRGR